MTLFLEGIRTMASLIWVFAIQIFVIGELFVLRVLIDWAFGFDYVLKFKDWWMNVRVKISGIR